MRDSEDSLANIPYPHDFTHNPSHSNFFTNTTKSSPTDQANDLTQSTSKLKSQVQASLTQTKSSKEEATKMIAKMEKRIEDIKLQEISGTTEIKKTFAELQAKLNEREAKLINELKVLVNQQLSSLQSQVETLKKITTAADHQCQVASTYATIALNMSRLLQSNDAQLNTSGSSLVKELNQVQSSCASSIKAASTQRNISISCNPAPLISI